MAAQGDLGNTHQTGSALWKVWENCWPGLCISQHGSFLLVGGRKVQKPFKASSRWDGACSDESAALSHSLEGTKVN